MNTKSTINNMRGFTLVELMVVVLLTAIAVVAIYRGYTAFSSSADAQEQIIEMQQNLRIGMHWLEKDLRRAGMEEEDDENAGFTIAGANTVEFTMDLGGATLGAYDDIKPCTGSPAGDGDLVDSCERISYARLDPDGDGVFGLYRNDVNEADNNEIITNVEALDFVYLDEDRTVTAVLDDIRLVQACLVVRTTNEDLRYTNNESYENINPGGPVQILGPQGDRFRRRVLCKEIKIRNAGL